MKTSLVTGGAGFLGSHLVDALLRRGHSVIVLDNLTTGRLGNLERAITTGRVTLIYADIALDRESLQGLLAGAGIKSIHHIYHLASATRANDFDEVGWDATAVNDLGAMALIELALRHRARLILSSVSSVSSDWLTEPGTDEAQPFAESAIAVAAAERGLDARIVRFFKCYGPRMPIEDGTLLPALFEAATSRQSVSIPGTGQEIEALTYVRDAIDLLLLVADRPQAALRTVDIGSDDERRIDDITSVFARTVGVTLDRTYGAVAGAGVPLRKPDLSPARALGWKPATSLQDGLRLTYDWFARESRLFV